MGINDQASNPKGDLYLKLLKAKEEERQQVLDEYYKTLQTSTSDFTRLIPNQTYQSLEGAYVATIALMRRNYPDADIYLMNLVPNKGRTAKDLEDDALYIKEVAEYFGCYYVDQLNDSGIDYNTNFAYTADTSFLHPNAAGMDVMAKCIINAMYEAKVEK